MGGGIIEAYAADAAGSVARAEAISSAELYTPVADLLPTAAADVLDVGAGTGRDAAWFANQGHRVLAVEPVDAFRRAGRSLHGSTSFEWLDDRLPDLPRLMERQAVFDRVLLTGVWQHLSPDERRRAMPRLAALTSLDGLLILSLRHGPGAPTRPCFEAPPQDTIDAGAAAGLKLVLRRMAPSIQAANRASGVAWTWLALRRGD